MWGNNVSTYLLGVMVCSTGAWARQIVLYSSSGLIILGDTPLASQNGCWLWGPGPQCWCIHQSAVSYLGWRGQRWAVVHLSAWSGHPCCTQHRGAALHWHWYWGRKWWVVMWTPVTPATPHSAPPEVSFHNAASPTREKPTRRYNYPQIQATLEGGEV